MKQKIKEAITQGYKNLGVPESVVDGLTALGVTVVKDESEIDAFVQGDAVKGVMKTFQSETDKVRSEYSAKLKEAEKTKAELEAKLNGNEPPKTDPPKEDAPDLAALIEAALDKKLNPITEKIATFEAENVKKSAVAALEQFVNKWDYAKGFPKESELSKRIALKVYKAGGEKMTGEELIAAFREEFDPAVQSKGVTDFSKPFEGDKGGGSEDSFDSDYFTNLYKGKVARENKPE